MWHEDEPFGGLPTVAYARLFADARRQNNTVILDGQGMDEQWAGYDYYTKAENGPGNEGKIQGTNQKPVRPECLTPEFRNLAQPFQPPTPFPDRLRNLQYRDIRYTKIPRALRFNDRVSMRSSAELREPFLDHRLFELALRQPEKHKIVNGTRKWLLRKLAGELIPQGVTEAPKRALQTPQREWLRGPLKEWAVEQREAALDAFGDDWLDKDLVRASWKEFDEGHCDNSFFVWQWIGLGMTAQMTAEAAHA
jgi:asparagine synthase (glutamine-hydrolysing)